MSQTDAPEPLQLGSLKRKDPPVRILPSLAQIVPIRPRTPQSPRTQPGTPQSPVIPPGTGGRKDSADRLRVKSPKVTTVPCTCAVNGADGVGWGTPKEDEAEWERRYGSEKGSPVGEMGVASHGTC
jgi:hypothetical protein